MVGLKKKIGAKGQQRLGQARPPREPNQAAPGQLAHVTNVQEHRQLASLPALLSCAFD